MPFANHLQHALRDSVTHNGVELPRYHAELWTARQRQSHSLHEVSYRACFKPELPRFFIERLTQPGDTVLDPFGGRGTSGLEAALLGRNAVLNDINPLMAVLAAPRFAPPAQDLVAVAKRLDMLLATSITPDGQEPALDMFYHPHTLAQLRSLRAGLAAGRHDDLNNWIRMVATNRLTGHSSGFFSVYTLPPNQATSAERQRKINLLRKQTPPDRDVRALILTKSAALLRDLDDAARARLRAAKTTFLCGPADQLHGLRTDSVQLTVTSPPFLDVVQYAKDNWLRLWFNGIDDQVQITMARTVAAWAAEMQRVFARLFVVTRPGGWVAFEVGEIRRGAIKLDEVVLPLAQAAGFAPSAVLVNTQSFTKTANIWGVANNAAGTNSNRIVLMQKP